MITSFAASSRKRVAWTSVELSLKYWTTAEPEAGVAQVLPYAAEAKAVYLTMLSKTADETAHG
jgi:hypothetical protein